jgi:hypothetical protein
MVIGGHRGIHRLGLAAWFCQVSSLERSKWQIHQASMGSLKREKADLSGSINLWFIYGS